MSPAEAFGILKYLSTAPTSVLLNSMVLDSASARWQNLPVEITRVTDSVVTLRRRDSKEEVASFSFAEAQFGRIGGAINGLTVKLENGDHFSLEAAPTPGAV